MAFSQLAPGQTQAVELNFQAIQQGSVANCAEVTAAGGLKADAPPPPLWRPPSRPPAIDVEVRGPTEADVRSQVTFEIIIANHGQTPATGLVIKDQPGPGPGTQGEKRMIESPPLDLAAGQRKVNKVKLQGRSGRPLVPISPGFRRQRRRGHGRRLDHRRRSPAADRPPRSPARQPREHAVFSVKKSGPPTGHRRPIGQRHLDCQYGPAGRNQPQRGRSCRPRPGAEMPEGGQRPLRQRGLDDSQPGGRGIHRTPHQVPLPNGGGTAQQSGHRHRPGRHAGREAVLPRGPRREPTSSPATTPSGLSVTEPAGLHNAVTAGQNLTYFVRVKNSGSTTERQVVLTADVPAAMADLIGREPPGRRPPSPPTPNIPRDLHAHRNPRSRRDPDLPHPGAGDAEGQFPFGVDVTSRGLGQPLHSEETTQVSQPPK